MQFITSVNSAVPTESGYFEAKEVQMKDNKIFAFVLGALSVLVLLAGARTYADYRAEAEDSVIRAGTQEEEIEERDAVITVGNHSYIPIDFPDKNEDCCKQILQELMRFEDYNATVLQVTNWHIFERKHGAYFVSGLIIDHQPKAPPQK